MAEKRSPNRLLQGFILVSLAVHVLIILHATGIYQSKALSFIELSLDQTAKPDIRVIPTPRIRQADLKVAEVRTDPVKDFKAPRIQVDEVQKADSQDVLNLPQLPDKMDVSGLSGSRPAGLNTGGAEGRVEFTNAKEYFDMLNLRVQRFKEYPESAKSAHIEGRVQIEFVLLKDGTLSEVKILKSSRHKNLDEAALSAVKKASPFPRPPDFLFKTPVTMRISILFELA
nr:energy transducer TonB [Desulfobacula sp.]